jgi:Xaa-Pro aminopeptidase
MSSVHAKRRNAVQAEVARRKADCLLITHPANWYYLTGFTGESGALVVSPRGTTLITDGRFTVQAKEETRGIRIELQKGALYAAVAEFLKR